MSKNNKKANKKIQNILIFAGFSAVILIVSTYAWFIGLQEVTVSEFQVEIASTDNLLISLNGLSWGETVTLTEGTWTAYDDAAATPSQVYDGNTNSWGGNGLMPISTVGTVNPATSKLELFERGSYTHTGGGFRLVADQLANTTTEVDGYVAFDLFIKNFTGAQYIEDYNLADEEEIYLLTDSGVSVAAAGTTDAEGNDLGYTGAADQGIENSVRVAFAPIGRVDGSSEDGTLIGGITCNGATGTVAGGVTGICTDAVIYEPNERNHEDNAINWFNTYCDNRSADDVDGNSVYTDTQCNVSTPDTGADGDFTDGNVEPGFTAFADNLELDTWAVSGAINSAARFDIYDGHNTFDPVAAGTLVENVDTFTDAEKLIAGNDRPAFMTLAPNSITKVRVYVYLEGNDLDNMDLSAAGAQILVNFGFTKQKFTEADFTP